MPNYAYNRVAIRGSRETLEEIASFLTPTEDNPGRDPEGWDFHFNKILPVPEEIANSTFQWVIPDDEYAERKQNNDPDVLSGWVASESMVAPLKEKYGVVNAHQWRVNRWGTKWEPQYVNFTMDLDAGLIMLAFDTPWCDPEGIFTELYKRFSEKDASFELAAICQYEGEGYGFYPTFGEDTDLYEEKFSHTVALSQEAEALWGRMFEWIHKADGVTTVDEFFVRLDQLYKLLSEAAVAEDPGPLTLEAKVAYGHSKELVPKFANSGWIPEFEPVVSNFVSAVAWEFPSGEHSSFWKLFFACANDEWVLSHMPDSE